MPTSWTSIWTCSAEKEAPPSFHTAEKGRQLRPKWWFLRRGAANDILGDASMVSDICLTVFVLQSTSLSLHWDLYQWTRLFTLFKSACRLRQKIHFYNNSSTLFFHPIFSDECWKYISKHMSRCITKTECNVRECTRIRGWNGDFDRSQTLLQSVFWTLSHILAICVYKLLEPPSLPLPLSRATTSTSQCSTKHVVAVIFTINLLLLSALPLQGV